MNIGNFTHDGKSFTGTINTLAISVQATIQPVEKTAPGAPTYRVYAGNLEIGAGWQKTSKGERPYLSIRIDDPSLPAAIYCRLIELKGGKHSLLWSR